MQVPPKHGCLCVEGAYLVLSARARIRLPELKRGAAVIAEDAAGHLRRVRGEAAVVADGAPEPPQEDLEAAVLIPRARIATHQPQVTVPA